MHCTVLIVDDSADGTMLTELAVSQLELGLRVKSVSSGKKALEVLADCPTLPALVFLDLKMPGLDGIDTLKLIRAEDRMKDLPVVITTLSTLQSDEDAAWHAGATAFIYKAIKFADFSKDIEHQVRQWVK